MDDIDFITDEITKEKQTKKAHSRKTETKRIKVRSSVEVAKDNFKQAKRLHRSQIKSLRRNIKTHKLMIRQARNTYRLIKLSNKR